MIKEFDFYKGKIKFYSPQNVPKKHIIHAQDIVKDIDRDDFSFVALHLYKKHKIWTGDKKLISGLLAKRFDICITTQELKAKLYKKHG